jgi:serine/threonine-protein kinase
MGSDERQTQPLSGPPAADAGPRDDLIGRHIGGYRIAARIGKGGMGAVYVGIHPTLGKRVAVKVLLAELAGSEELRRRFFEEARAAAALDHPGVVEILDLALLPDGRCYILMEHLDGESLGAMLRRRGPLPPAEACAIAVQILSALAAAHARGIVHRDLKPANLFVARTSERPRVKVLDFGIAKLQPAPGTDGLTATHAVLGTPGYMAPEQASGRARTVDARADVYAVGVVLYEMLAGQRPFESPDWVQLLVEQRTHAPAPLAHVALDAVARRALAVDPAARWPDVDAMRAAIVEAIGGDAALAPIPEPAAALADDAVVDRTVETGPPSGAAAEPTAHTTPGKRRPPPAATEKDTAPPAHARSGRGLTIIVAVGLLAAGIAAAYYIGRGSADREDAPAPIANVPPPLDPALQPPVDAATPAAVDPPATADAGVAVASKDGRKRPPPPVRKSAPPDAGVAAVVTPPPEEPKPKAPAPAMKFGQLARGSLGAGGKRSYRFTATDGVRARIAVKGEVEEIGLMVYDPRGYPVGSAGRLMPSQFDGCNDCEAWIDVELDGGEYEVRLSAPSGGGTFVLTIERR